MNTADPLLQTDFVKEMMRQLRAMDSYGVYDGKSNEELLAQMILTPERKAEIPLVGDPDEDAVARLRAFYNAIATLIEKECGLMATPVISLSHEGFGRALIIVGKLVALDKTLRDVHRFGFSTLAQMKTEGDKLLSIALERIGAYPEAAGL
ncbi:MAG: NifX-associated nitrogen fixation protein [Rhodocyclaceae bacterium]|nr:NifX-associated nitrogen fixation protein [Rhodocyclaceae bacterium]